MKLTKDAAWELASKYGKTPPYKGYALDFGDGLVLTQTPRGEFILLDFPVTPEKVAAFEKENADFIASLPTPDVSKLLEMIKKQ